MVRASQNNLIRARPIAIGDLNTIAWKLQCADTVSLKHTEQCVSRHEADDVTYIANIPDVHTVVEQDERTEVAFARCEAELTDGTSSRVERPDRTHRR